MGEQKSNEEEKVRGIQSIRMADLLVVVFEDGERGRG